ncbi:MAG: acid shock protein [Clostridia bacterium]|nr:acid shock protein [Clostridia bacterium]
MKKVLAILLALVMALSCSAIAFADDASTDAAPAASEAVSEDVAALDVKEVLAMIVELAKASMTQWNDVETVVIKIVDFVDGLVNGIFGDGVDGLIAELEGLFEGIEIPGIDELINALKEKILSFYAPGVAPTKPAKTPETGSAPVGIAVFAAVSVAAAAAFVCTKKD